MKSSFLSKGVLVASAVCLAAAALPVSLKAAGPKVVAVNRTNSPGEISSMLEQIRLEAISVKNNADQLQMLTRESEIGWEGDASLLEDLRDQVNEMNKQLYDLRAHEAEASPLQQEIIDRMAPPTLELVGTTQKAIVTLDNNELHVFTSSLPTLANEIYNEASRVARTVGDFDKYSHSLQEEQQLKQSLGL